MRHYTLCFALCLFGVLSSGPVLGQSSDVIPEPCILPPLILPQGINQKPLDTVPGNWTAEYEQLFASTLLQGNPTTEKFAPAMFFPSSTSTNPTFDTSGIFWFYTYAVANNTNAFPISVTFEIYDSAGVLLTTPGITRTINPNGFFMVPCSALIASPTRTGMVRMFSSDPFVGATIHRTYGINNNTEPHPDDPGATSMQQAQVEPTDDATTLMWVTPVSTISSVGFFNGNLPFFSVINPSATQPANLTIVMSTTGGVTIGPYAVTLPPRGAHFDMTLWNALLPVYNAAIPYDDNVRIAVFSDRPVIGEGMMVDNYGPGMTPNGHFRMGSTMMANQVASALVNSELTTSPNPVSIDTQMVIWNAATVDIGPVNIDYIDQAGTVLATAVNNPFPSGTVLRIGPGSPGYPAGIFAGWVRIRSCLPGLVGWTMRPIEGPEGGWQRVYGESMHGNNGAEPGNGFTEMSTGINFTRKTGPFTIASTGAWPGFTLFQNDSVPNSNTNNITFFDQAGFDRTFYVPFNFAGLRFANSSFTYEDGVNTRVSLGFQTPLNVMVDVTTGFIKGITTIGGILYDPELQFEYPFLEPYAGPEDVVPVYQ